MSIGSQCSVANSASQAPGRVRSERPEHQQKRREEPRVHSRRWFGCSLPAVGDHDRSRDRGSASTKESRKSIQRCPVRDAARHTRAARSRDRFPRLGRPEPRTPPPQASAICQWEKWESSGAATATRHPCSISAETSSVRKLCMYREVLAQSKARGLFSRASSIHHPRD